MELTISNLKEILFNTLGKDLIEEGFLFSKLYFEFNKKVGKNKAKVRFVFYDYKPGWLDFNYFFYFTIDEIYKETKKLYDYCGLKYDNYTASFCEGDFHPPTKDKELKFRIAFVHRIYDFEKSLPELDYSQKILRENFLPKIPIYTNLVMFQNHVLENYEIIGTNQVFAISVLVAAKLKGIAELEKLVPFIWQKFDLETKPDSDVMKKITSKIIPYAKDI